MTLLENTFSTKTAFAAFDCPKTKIMTSLILVTPTDSCSVLHLFSVPHSWQDFPDLFSCKGFSCYSCRYSWIVFQHSVGTTRMINLPAELGWISKNLPLGPWAAPSGLWAGFYWPTLALLAGSSQTSHYWVTVNVPGNYFAPYICTV